MICSWIQGPMDTFDYVIYIYIVNTVEFLPIGTM